MPQTRYIRIEPGSLGLCAPAVATGYWDASTLSPPPASMKVHVIGGDGEHRFAAGGHHGTAEIGQ